MRATTRRKQKIISWLLTAATFLAISCGGKKMTLDPKTLTDSQLYEIGQKYLKDEAYDKARDAFKTVFENFPKSDYRILAKLAYADSFFAQGTEPNYLLAVQEYQDFISLFPFSPKAEFAQLQIGVCYYQLIEKPDRDQSNTRKALEEFRKVVDGYPSGEYYRPAYEYLLKCYSRLAEHEFLIARYYQRTGKHQAAVDRLKGILKSYPESIFQPKYFFAVARSLEELRQYSESCTYYETLLEKWPTSEYSSDARESRTKICK